MKKYMILFSVTLLLIIVAGLIPGWAERSLTETTVVTVKKGSYTETVTANGIIEYSDKIEITTELPFIPGEVYVEIGDKVTVGDLLARVDKGETVTAVMSLLNISGIDFSDEVMEVFSSQSVSVSELEALLPDQILATASGTVTDVQVVKGAVAMPDTALVTISDSEKLQTRVAILESAAAKVKEGQRVTVTGTALKDKAYSGTVVKVYPTARQQYSGTTQQTVVDALIQFDQTDDGLKSGYSVKAEIVTGAEREFPCLPYETIGQDDLGEFVYVYRAGQAQKKYIETGIELADGVEIVSGIDAEDRVLNHAEELTEDRFVRIVGTE